LERYFAEEGSSEPEVLLIPQGSYVPVLRRREQPQPPDLVVVPERPRKTSRLVLALAGLSGVLAIVCGVLLFQVLRVSDNATAGPTVQAFWQRFEGDQQTSVILADSALAAVQDALEAPLSVDQYAQRQWDGLLKQHAGSPDEMALLRYLLARRYTSLADAQIVKRLYEAQLIGDRSTVLHARDASVRAFHSGNHVLIGSQRAIPWVRLFEDRMDFRLRTSREDFSLSRDGAAAPVVIENHDPQDGEPASYRSQGRGTSGSEAFAIVACLPNLSRTGNVLILAGSEASGTEAAGNLLTDEQRMGALLQRVKAEGSKVPYFEALLRVWHLENTGRSYEVIAFHSH
ncbi:MAG: hypothetical protein H7039_16025, partial [Bryobacteraceae bacterium]|nr:hypothetical protein [Bryobacteraceae bacterium]